jgi:opacity protein-like surface antigen
MAVRPLSSAGRARSTRGSEHAGRGRSVSLLIPMSMAAMLGVQRAWAESPLGFYAGGSIGASDVSVASDDGFFASHLTGEEDSLSALHFGYRVRRHLGAEFGYFETGPAWERFAYPPQFNEVYRYAAELDVQVAQITVVGILPFARLWEAYAKGGVALSQADADQTLTRMSDGAALATGQVDSSHTGPVVGLGVGVSPTPAWHVRLEIQSFEVEGELLSVATPTSVDTWLFSFQYAFGAKARSSTE